MHILVVLDVAANNVIIADVFNEELTAQDHFLDKIAELSHSKDPAVEYECQMITKTRCHLRRVDHGYVYGQSKTLEKIVTLHFIDYEIAS